MTSKETILKIMQDQGKTKADFAGSLGISQAALWDRLESPKKKSITVNKFNEMLRALGYELVVMPRGKAGRMNDVITVNDEVMK